MEDTATRKNWAYVEISSDDRATLRAMAKAEGKSVEEVTQEILAPAIKAETDRYREAQAKAAAEAEAAKAAAAKSQTAPEPVEA